jgi:hypothetical protein
MAFYIVDDVASQSQLHAANLVSKVAHVQTP